MFHLQLLHLLLNFSQICKDLPSLLEGRNDYLETEGIFVAVEALGGSKVDLLYCDGSIAIGYFDRGVLHGDTFYAHP